MPKNNLVISAMFLEMSRGFLSQEIEIKQDKNLKSIDDIPEIVKLNIKFTQFAGSVIFSISSLEAYINLEIHKLLSDHFNVAVFAAFDNYGTIQHNIAEFKAKYSEENKREELYKKETLTKKINKLYKCFDLQLLSESPNKEDQKLWNNLEKLQSIRNELIHPKPTFIESEEFKEFFNQGDKEFNEGLNTPIIIRFKLFKGTPLFHPNEASNTILNKYIFSYKADAILEHLLLTSSEYNINNVRNWGTRWIF
jgi:hypothetical protein